ncbi:unnamed protein product [Meloidogyne enterolobii]|uniref:Uncharacterized protein n=1 Tax=Meloidogyne enterolobii TaxID=390850 RepID=A0ACB1ADP4_MELEN
MSSTYLGKYDFSSSSNQSHFDGVFEFTINEIGRLTNQQLKVRHRPTPKPGLTGLSNKINSCFINAVMQCLFNTNKFVHLFEGRSIRKHVNLTNMGKSKGALSACLSAYINAYWSSEYSYLNTNTFLVEEIN